MSEPAPIVSRLTPWAGGLFFLSGASSLGFEIVWSAQLSRVLGGSTAAIAFVVAMFMGGMAAGFAVGGRIAPRVARPLAAYGLAEIALGCAGAVAVHVLPSLEQAVSLPVAYVLAGVTLFPVTFLAGITLPLLVDFTRGSVGGALGRLYALNTLGAAAGVLAVGMLCIGALGHTGTAHLLAALGSTVGLVACWLGRSPRRIAPSTVTPPAAVAAPSDTIGRTATEPTAQSFPTQLALGLALIVGATSLAEEVLWTRALLPHVNSSTYALSAILAVFLLGLALGAWIASALIERGRDPALLLGVSQVAAGLLVLYSPEALWLAGEAVGGYVGIRQVGGFDAWLAMTANSLGRVTLALLPPTILLGMALPTLAELYARELRARGPAVGRIGGANTLGAVIGSLSARFVILPTLGLGMGLQWLVLLHALVATTAIARRTHKPLWIALPLSLVIGALARPPAEPFLGRLAEDHPIVLVDEGVQDTTAVVELEDGSRQIFSNGIAYAGDSPGARRYMRLLGHLPALLARKQRRALVICVGTGMTAAAVARHPAFRVLDLVDISRVVSRTLPLFGRSNDRIHRTSRARVHIEDGRVFVARAAPKAYDLVTMEPPPPRAAGVSALYSRELYQRAAALLADGGAFAQWLPLHGMTHAELRMLARTFVDVFPDATLYLIHPVEAALIATRGPGADHAEIARRLEVPGVRHHLDSIGAPNPLALPSVRGPALRRALGPGPVVTDDHPRIEHFAAGLGGAEDTAVAGQRFLAEVLAAGDTQAP